MNCFVNDSVKHLTTLKYTNQDRKWLPQKWICHYRHKWDSKHLSILWMDKNYIVFKHANYCWIEMALMCRTFISCPLFLAKTISCMQNLHIFNIIPNHKSPIKWPSLEQSRSCSPVSLQLLVIPPKGKLLYTWLTSHIDKTIGTVATFFILSFFFFITVG